MTLGAHNKAQKPKPCTMSMFAFSPYKSTPPPPPPRPPPTVHHDVSPCPANANCQVGKTVAQPQKRAQPKSTKKKSGLTSAMLWPYM